MIDYEQILNLFWNSHNPAGRAWSRQYMSIIFYHSDEQNNVAIKSRIALEKKLGVKVYTGIVPFSEFYLAEDYHQKYYLQSKPVLAGEILAYYPEFSGFINSTAAARLNGFVAGYGDAELLAEELDSYGLSSSGRELLQKINN